MFAFDNRPQDSAKNLSVHARALAQTAPGPSLRAVLACALAAATLALAACAANDAGSARTERDWQDEGRALFGPAADAPEQPPEAAAVGQAVPAQRGAAPSAVPPVRGAAASSEGWSIVLESFSGPGSVERAGERLPAVAAASGRSDARVRPTESGAAIVAGRFESAGSSAAREALASLRERKVEGRRPFARAFMVPPRAARSDQGTAPELSLSRARAVHGAKVKYSLQIAVYESKDQAEARRAAEAAAAQLRGAGELAFYHHGPIRSMVTVGLFEDKDFDANLRPRDAGLIALQQRYPLNLLNGQYPVVERDASGGERQQPSTLVVVP